MLQKMTGTIRVRLHLEKVMDLSLMPQAMSINILGVNHIRVSLCGDKSSQERKKNPVQVVKGDPANLISMKVCHH